MADRGVRDPVTLASWLATATEALARSGSVSPRGDAERLASAGLGVAWSRLWGRLRDDLDGGDVGRLDALVDRRARGEPLAYILGNAEFHGHTLRVGPGVLVPRPETETLVDVALDLLSRVSRPRVVDVGTGSGAVAIAVAAARPTARVLATDVSAEALEYARSNASVHGVAVELVQGDLFDGLPVQLRGRLDLVVSNPPYIPLSSRARLPADVLAEPPEALFGGVRGDEVLCRIAAQAREWLAPGGAVALEVGSPGQVGTVLRAARPSWHEVREDHAGRQRVVSFRL